VKDREIDALLEKAARAPQGVNPELLERVAATIRPSLQPVRPLPATWILVAGLVLICLAVALAGAARAGFYGIAKMDLFERLLIFAALAVFALVAAIQFVGELIPGSRRRVSPGVLLGFGTVALLGVFALLFRDYHTDQFVHAGLVCLFAGLFHAIPAGLVCWWLLRRGFAVNSVAAGFVGGTLAGLAGVTLLELHCANFEALHILIWHTAVVPVSAALGALVAWALHFRASHRSSLRAKL
jgi:hypothetical protein